MCVKIYIEEKDSRLDAAFTTYKDAQLLANMVKERYTSYLKTSVSFNTKFRREGRKIDVFSNEIIKEVATSIFFEQERALGLQYSTEDLKNQLTEGILI